MKEVLVKYTVNQNNASELTQEELAARQAVMALPDSEIDYSDIPPQGDEDWSNAVRGAANIPHKEEITVSLDADIVAWLKSSGKGYQIRLNDVLRGVMALSNSSNKNL